MAENGHGTGEHWALAERRWPPMAWVILAAGTALCAIAAFLS